MKPIRQVFFVSDRTGITAESMGLALLNQFDNIDFKRATYPFVDTKTKAEEVVALINRSAQQSDVRPLVFSSIVDENIREQIKTSAGLHMSFYDAFIGELEEELGTKANHSIGRTHGMYDTKKYDKRMDAINFALNNDDGITDRELQHADVILMGVSRSGKTPTCLYLALQYGIRAANYPLIPEDLESSELPRMVKPFRQKLYGLTIDADRLHHIRSERRPDSRYASKDNCRHEILTAEDMYRRFNIPYTNTTHKSIEELAASIILAAKLQRRI